MSSCRSPKTIHKAATINDQCHVMCILNNTFTYELCDLGEVPELLCASVSSFVKWEYCYCLSHGV